ncbi:hypothetical protein [Singulisphaera sp. PoT]|uniref:hypothetical protein n=1 Tax=Singulisphaera sp. PoT TaxID=3411797 RepID=UPI003BF4C9CD
MRRVPSRRMPPPRPSEGPGLRGWALLLIFVVSSIIGVAAWIVAYPAVAIPLMAALVLTMLGMHAEGKARRSALARGREGESICTFARSFDCRRTDTWILRAVYEALQPHCRVGDRMMPIRSTDELATLGLDGEDIAFVAEEVAYRSGRSMEGMEANPYSFEVVTVEDLVAFMMHQPRESAA